MNPVIAGLVVLVGFAGTFFLASSLRRLGQLTKARAALSAEDRAAAAKLVPAVERFGCYAAVILVVMSVLAFRWSPAGGWGPDLRLLAFAVGFAAVSYVVWFSVRWRHLK